MIPEIITILKERKKLSLRELSILSKQKEEVTEQIMEQLARKKLVRKKEINCSGCLKECSACLTRGELIFYEIIE